MSRIKTKRILWTIAVLVVLSFAAGLVLHKHVEPKIIGNFSPADISAISKATLKAERGLIKVGMRWHLKHRKVISLMRDTVDYAFINVLSIEDQGSPRRDIHVTVQPQSARSLSGYYLAKKGADWKIVGFDMVNQPLRD
jgi:hypothetical protein